MLNYGNKENAIDRLPTNLQFNTSNYCNYQCSYCAFHSAEARAERKRKKQYNKFMLTMADFEKQVNVFKPYYPASSFPHITFTGMGEPFTNPDMLPIMRYCVDNQITFGIITNFSRLTTPNIEPMIDLGIRKIETNIDGDSKEVYEALRPKAHWETTIKNIETTANLIAKKASQTVFQVHYLITPHNKRYVFKCIDLLASLGVKYLRIKPVAEYEIPNDQGKFFSQVGHQKDLIDLTVQAWDYGASKGINIGSPLYLSALSGRSQISLRKITQQIICPSPLIALHINFAPMDYSTQDTTGNVQLGCPIRTREEFSTFGNLYRDSLPTIINHPARLKIINSMLSKNHYDICKKCEYQFLEVYDILDQKLAAAEPHLNQGVASIKSGNASMAIDSFNQALKIDQAIDEAHNGMGIALMKVGRLKEALEHFLRALNLDQENRTYILNTLEAAKLAKQINIGSQLVKAFLPKHVGDAQIVRAAAYFQG